MPIYVCPNLREVIQVVWEGYTARKAKSNILLCVQFLRENLLWNKHIDVANVQKINYARKSLRTDCSPNTHPQLH